MSAEPEIYRAGRPTTAQVVAGYLSSLAIFCSLISIAWKPLRLSLVSMLVALVGVALAGDGPRKNLALAGVLIAAFSFFAGMAVAVVTSHSLW